MSLYGGSLTGYYSDNKLVLITADHEVAYCSNEYSYYIKNDSLVFVTEQITKIKEPDNFDEYIKNHTDKSNNTDLSKLPLEINDDNQYYFHDDKIIACRMKSFKKKIIIVEDIVGEKNRMLVMFYKSHLDELKAIK